MANLRSNTSGYFRVKSDMAMESTINQKAYDKKSDSRNAPAEWESSNEVGEQTWVKFIKVSFDPTTTISLHGATDSAQDFNAYFMTSVGSNPILTQNTFLSFLALICHFYTLFYIL